MKLVNLFKRNKTRRGNTSVVADKRLKRKRSGVSGNQKDRFSSVRGIPKRITSTVLVLVTLISMLIIGVSSVNADSNDRIATFIQLAATGEVTDGNTSSMTEDQLRFLGIYLSNFYKPFVTELGTAAGENTDKVKEDMKKSLQEKLAFSEDLSTSLVDTIFGYTRSSMKKLSFYIKDSDFFGRNYNLAALTLKVDDKDVDEYADEINVVPLTDGHSSYFPITNIVQPVYYNFYNIMINRLDTLLRKEFNGVHIKNLDQSTIGSDGNDTDGDMTTDYGLKVKKKNIDLVSKFVCGKNYNDGDRANKDTTEVYYRLCIKNRKKIYIGYADGSNIKIVGDAFVGGDSTTTAFQAAYLKCLEVVGQPDKGYGTSMLDLNYNEVNRDKDNLDSIKDSLTDDQAIAMCASASEISVDCFGNICYMGGNHQYVIIPGCLNPYTWEVVNSEGNSEGLAGGGKVYIMANAISISQALSTKTSSSKNDLFSSIQKIDTSNMDSWSAKTLVTHWEYDWRDAYKQEPLDIYGMSLHFPRLNKAYDNMKSIEGAVYMPIISGSSETDFNKGFFGIGEEEDAARDITTQAFEALSKKPFAAGYHFINNAISNRAHQWNWAWGGRLDGYYTGAPNNGGEKTQGESEVPVNMKMVMIDNLGAYVGDSGSNWKAFHAINLLNDEGSLTDDETAKKINGYSVNSFGSIYNDVEEGKVAVPVDVSEQTLSSLYVTYCWACLYSEENKKETIGKIGFKFNGKAFPDMSNKPISLSDMAGIDIQTEAIKNWTYYLLHPTKGFEYVRRLITNKVNHLLLGWHSDMVGTNGVGATVGTTKYRSNMGYVTMPDLSEINWTNKLIQIYNDCIPFFIIALIIIMLFAFIVGALNLQHAAFGVLIFAVFTLLPVNLINGVVGYSNRISQNAYGDKFTYWALVQQESYGSAIDEAANRSGDGSSSYENYLRTLYSANEKVYSNQGSESILLKWQAPKKMASLVLTEADAKSLGGLNEVGVKMLNGMLNRSYSGQSYVDDEDAVYMYRSYTDISNFSRYIYDSIRTKKVQGIGFPSSMYSSGYSLPKEYTEILKDWKAGNPDYYTSEYTTSEGFTYPKDCGYYISTVLQSNIISDALKDSGKLDSFNSTNKMVNINSDLFNFGLPQFNQNSSNFPDKWSAKTFAATGGISESSKRYTDLASEMSKYTEEDYVGLAVYGLYSENPYYYFSWRLFADGLKSDSYSARGGYKDLLLSKPEGGYFYNTSKVAGNSELKDFMDLRSLFYVVIPYMKQCNDMVREWDDLYGIFVYDGIPTEEGHWDEMTTDEMKQKYWHNLNVTRLYCLYCPWVDVMYDCSYSKSETINVMGRRVTIDDPIDPRKYPKDRPMIFSASEMSDYGLNEADLTSVEKKILRCNEQFEDRMYELLNYYKFSDITLNSAAAINCAFVFNNMFSENGIFTENHNIYPQSFDLSNFSYDAFLRLILANATGENLIDASTTEDSGMATGDLSGDFYERLVNRSSTITVIIMLILDVLSVYLIPAFRIFFLVAIFLASVFIVLTSAFRIESSAKFIRKVGMQFFLPLIAFFLTTIAFSLIVGLFIGEGNNKVTETGLSISLGDPVVTMLVMIALDLILLFVYWKIIKKVLTDIRGHAKAVGSFIGGVGSAAVGFVAGAVAAGAGSAQDRARGVSGRYKAWKTNRALKGNAANGGKGSIEEQAQNGTGIENGRANERGSTGSADYSEERSAVRDVEKDRGKTLDVERGVDAEERKAEIDSKAKSGDIEGSDSDGRKSHRSYDTVGSNTGSESADSINSKTSSGANTDSTGGVTSNRALREKVKQGYKPDSYDREEARRKGIPSNGREGSDVINRSVGGKDNKGGRVPRHNSSGNNRASDRGRKPVETRPNREKVSKSKKDPRIHGNK